MCSQNVYVSFWDECKQSQRCSVRVLFTFLQETTVHSEPGCILGFDDIQDFLILLLALGTLLLIVCQTLNQKNVANTIKNNGSMQQSRTKYWKNVATKSRISETAAANTIKNNENMLQQNQEYQKHVATIIKNIRNMQPLTQKKWNGVATIIKNIGNMQQLQSRIVKTCCN